MLATARLALGVCLLVAAARHLPSTSALQITFPTSSSGWVSCKSNPLTWSAEANDPEYFSVQLLNRDPAQLNGNYQIGNALETANGSALLAANCVTPGSGYYLALVNSSNYELDKPQVFFTSPEFSIAPNTTEVRVPSGYSLTNNGTTLVGGGSSSSVSSTSSSNATSPSNQPPIGSVPTSSTGTSSTTAAPSSTRANGTASTVQPHKNGATRVKNLPVISCLTSLLIASSIAAVL